MNRTKLNLTMVFILAACMLTGCGKDSSEQKNSSGKSSTAVTTVSEATESNSTTVTAADKTEAATTQTAASNDASVSDHSVADLVGEWVQQDIGNVLTVNDDGSFSVKYVYGGTRFGTVKVEADQSYSFYQADNTLWAGFACTEKPFNEIYSENDGGMTFIRNTTGKYIAPTVPEAKDIRDALAFADRLMSGSAVNTDADTEYTTDDGTVYHKSVDGLYRTTADVRNYLSRYMTEQFLSSSYASIFGTEHPKCIDVNSELYIEYRPIGGVYSFEDADPVVVDNGSGYSIEIKNNDYGAENTVTVNVVKEDGKWKINDVQ